MEMPKYDLDGQRGIKQLLSRINAHVSYTEQGYESNIDALDRQLESLEEAEKAMEEHAEHLAIRLKSKKDSLQEEIAKIKKDILQKREKLKSRKNLDELKELMKVVEDAQLERAPTSNVNVNNILSRLASLATELPQDIDETDISFFKEDSCEIGEMIYSKVKLATSPLSTADYLSQGISDLKKVPLVSSRENISVPELVWQRGGLKYGCSLAFTPIGNIAITDSDNKKVLLLNDSGKLITDTAQEEVILDRPRAIAYYKPENALIVADHDAGKLKLLNESSLQFIRNIEVDGIERPYGIAVLDDFHIVVTQEGQNAKVGVYDVTGHHVQSWTRYGKEHERNFRSPWRLAINKEGIILVSDWYNQDVSMFYPDGSFIGMIDMDDPCGLFGEQNSDFLVVQDPFKKPHKLSLYQTISKISCVQDILQWGEEEMKTSGRMRAVARQGCHLVVLGDNGVRMYNLKS